MDKLALFGGSPLLRSEDHGRWPQVTAEDKAAVMEVLDRGLLSGMYAPATRAFEADFAKYVGAKHALLTHCGTSALQLAVAAAGIGAGDEVIVPAYTFIATAFACLQEGAIPIFADVDEYTGLIDPASVEAAISPRTRAIMPVHVHGCPADLNALSAIAKKHNLLLLEDAAQAHGATYQGKPVGALFAAGGFSLQSSKNLSAGEGGVFVTNDDAIAEQAIRLRNFGQDVIADDARHFDLVRPLDGHRGLESLRIGSMYRGNEMMAAFARTQLARLPELTSRAQTHFQKMSHALSELPGLKMQAIGSDRTSVHHKVRLWLDPKAAGVPMSTTAFRDGFIKALRAEGVEVVLWQNAPVPEHAVFQKMEGFGRNSPWSAGGAEAMQFARKNYAMKYEATRRLLDGSVILFSQSCPLIAQNEHVVGKTIQAIQKVWHHRGDLARAVAQ
ncbi:MAG: DegT/DnrJ/EryC1/StrS family aminotransferase [Polyangiaceae bacterium]|nr:DegT/DnrJ/EryC1/StrS family aminotransferase [Polyangiaceae bacterium]